MHEEGERRRRLRELLLSLFKWEQLRIFLSDYAGPMVVRSIDGGRTAQELVFEAIEQLAFHGLIVEALFMQLVERFPGRRDDVMHAAADWGIGNGTMLPSQGLEALHRAVVVQRDPAAVVRCIADNFTSYFKALRGELLTYSLAHTFPEAGAFVVDLWLMLPEASSASSASTLVQPTVVRREPPRLEEVSVSSELLFEEDIELLEPSEPPLVTESDLSATESSLSIVLEPSEVSSSRGWRTHGGGGEAAGPARRSPVKVSPRGWTFAGADDEVAGGPRRQRISSQCYVVLPRHEQVTIFRCLHDLVTAKPDPADAAEYLCGISLPPGVEHVHCFMGDRRRFSFELSLAWERSRPAISRDVSLATLQSLILELTRRAIGSERLLPRASALTEFLGLR